MVLSPRISPRNIPLVLFLALSLSHSIAHSFAQTSTNNSVAATAAAQSKLTARLIAPLPDYLGPSNFIGRPALVAISADGRTIAVSGEGRTVKLFDAATGKLKATLSDKPGLNGFAFSPDGRTAATRNLIDRSVKLWDVESGQVKLSFAGRRHNFETKLKSGAIGQFFMIPYRSDGRAILTEREDDLVTVWDTSSGKETATLDHKTETNAAKDVLKLAIPFKTIYPLFMQAAFSPDGKRIVTANGDKTPKLWDAETGALIASLSGLTEPTYLALFCPDNRTILTYSIKGEVNLWDAETGKLRAKIVDRQGRTYGLALSFDGQTIATQVDDTTSIWDTATAKLRQTIKRNKASLFSLSNDGQLLATAGEEKRTTAKVWDTTTGQLKFALPRTEADTQSVVFSPNGRVLLTTSDRGVKLWDATNGELLATLDKARFPTAFSRDGRLLLTGGTNDTALLYKITMN